MAEKLEPRAEPPRRDANKPVVAELRRQGDNIRVLFPFGQPTPAAVFQRAQTLWLVFDSAAKLDVAVLANEPSRTVRSAAVTRSGEAQVVRLQLERPRLASVAAEGAAWALTIGDQVQEPTKPLMIGRNIVGPSRTSITIPFDEPRAVHRLDDPEIGDTLLVVTALGPARGFVKSPGVRRVPRAGLDPRRGDPAARRRSRRGACARQDRARAARRTDAVGIAGARPPGQHHPLGDVRPAALGFRPRGEFHRPAASS